MLALLFNRVNKHLQNFQFVHTLFVWPFLLKKYLYVHSCGPRLYHFVTAIKGRHTYRRTLNDALNSQKSLYTDFDIANKNQNNKAVLKIL